MSGFEARVAVYAAPATLAEAPPGAVWLPPEQWEAEALAALARKLLAYTPRRRG